MMNIILWLSIIWLAPLMCFVLGNEAKFKKNIAAGVTLPYEGRQDGQVLARLSRFKKELGVMCLFLLLLALPCMLVRSLAGNMTLWFLWLDLCVFLPFIPYVRCNRELKRIKRQRGWNINAGQTLTVDTAAVGAGRWLSPWLFLPPLLLCLLPLVFERTFWFVYLMDGLCVVLFWFCYRFLYRNRAELVDENTQLTLALTQVRRKNWATVWLISAWFMVILNLCIWLSREKQALMLLLVPVFSFLFCAAAIGIEFKTRQIQEKLTAESGQRWYRDEDDLWIGGVLYYNPKDSRLVVNDRVGLNSSLNLAKTSGKVIYGLILLLLLAMPFTVELIDGIGTKPPMLEVRETELISSRGSREDVIPLENISSVELREKLPENLSRTFGTGMETLLEGNFSCPELGTLKLRLDPTCPPFILVKTADGQTWLFGTRDEALTRAVVEKLNG